MPDPISAAARLLLAGKLVAFPTETVYGLGGDATNSDAVTRIFQVKGRPPTNPLICHVADAATAERYAADWPATARDLAAAVWPGPLTLVVKKSPAIASAATAGGDTVGLRAPDHPLTLQLLRAVDRPIAGPSANRSTRVSPTTAAHVRDELGDAVEMILDGGPCCVGIESTVVDCTSATPVILRPGGISLAALRQIVPTVEMVKSYAAGEAARSPGLMDVHYSPDTPAYRVDAAAIERFQLPAAAILRCADDPTAYARTLYAALRQLDAANLPAIFVEWPPDSPEWLAVRDRLHRATQPLPADYHADES